MIPVTQQVSPEYWQRYLDGKLAEIKDTLSNKSTEYAVSTDKLHNFNKAVVAAAGRYNTREGALFGMMLKHWVSILDILDKLDDGTLPTQRILSEKFGDMIAYLLLLEASIQHRLDTKNETQLEP